MWVDQPKKNYKIIQIRVEFMQNYKIKAFLRSCKDCLMLKLIYKVNEFGKYKKGNIKKTTVLFS